MAKSKKKRSEQYDPKLAINGSFEDVIRVSVGKLPENQPEVKKEKPKKDKK